MHTLHNHCDRVSPYSHHRFHVCLLSSLSLLSSLHGLLPSVVLLGLGREHATLKKLKNHYMEELERVQLEETLIRRQLEEMQHATNTDRTNGNAYGTASNSNTNTNSRSGNVDVLDEADSDEQLRLLLEEDLAQSESAMAGSSATAQTDKIDPPS